MLFEFLGFLAGAGAIATVLAMFVRHERHKLLRSLGPHHGLSRAGNGNALIWPGR
jgi:hypothetical protein